jgi:hypothetical protein
LGAAQLTIPALVGILLGIALGVIGLLQRISPAQQETRSLPPGMRLGSGPHADVDCRPNEDLVKELISMIEQLREAATEEQWSVDWEQFNTRNLRGKKAFDAHDFPSAVREYATTLHFMMNELRNQQARVQTGDFHSQPRPKSH